MDRERLDNWLEKGILGLVLGILVFGPIALGGEGTVPFLVLEGLTLGAMVLWGIRLWISPKPQLLWTPLCWAVVAFVGYAVVRYLQADIEYVARRELIRILIYAFLFFIVLNNLHRQETTQIIAMTVIVVGMAISCLAAYQYFTKAGKVWGIVSAYPGRAGGTFYYPNNLAGYLEMLVPLGFAYVMVGRLSHLAKVFLAYACFTMLVGIGVTLSRGGWIVTALVLLGLCGVLLTQRNYRLHALALLCMLVVGGYWVAPKLRNVQERFARTFSSGKADDLRFSIWRPAYQIWQDNFWVGAGPDHFDYVFRKYRPEDVQLRPGRAHNDYLNTLADWGVVGTVIVASAWVVLSWGVAKSWRAVRGAQDDFSRKKSNKFAFVLGASMGLVSVLIHAVVDFNMHTPAVAMLAVTLMALVSSHLRFATEAYWFNARSWGRWAAAAALVLGTGYLGYQGWKAGAEYRWLNLAKKTPEHSSATIAALEKAYEVDPMNFETTYALGECYRLKSWEGGDNYETLAKKAMEWYQKGAKLNRFDGYNWLRQGMCLDWIGPNRESWSYYQRANELDPNGYYTTANTGWHFVQSGDYAAARTWLERSLRLEIRHNDIARQYIPIVNRRLKEAAEAGGGKRL